MNQHKQELLINAWVIAQKAGGDSPLFEKNWWAVEQFLNLPRENPELIWELILKIIEKETDKDLLGMLAAGPIEDLMCEYGEEIIDRVEKEAQSSSLFKNCIQGVWLDSKDTLVWKRFYQIAGIEPPFDEKDN